MTTPQPRHRSRRSAKTAGTRFETLIAGYLAEHIDSRIERRTRNGTKDRGDLSALRLIAALGSGRLVAELKNLSRLNLAAAAREAEIERGNDDAVAGLVIHKRHGNRNPGEQWVTCTVDDLVALLTGRRPAPAGNRPLRAAERTRDGRTPLGGSPDTSDVAAAS